MKFGKSPQGSSIDFSRITEDFRNLNQNDPSSWPLIPRLVALVAIVAVVIALGWWFFWSNQWSELESSRNREGQLKASWLDKKRQAINLDLLKAQLEEIDQQFGALLRQLPNRAQMDALLQDINQVGLEEGLEFELFRPSKDRIHDFYAEMPVHIRVIGSFHELGEFAGGTARMPRIVALNNIAISQSQSDANLLVLEGEVVTYRYLEPSEMPQPKTQQTRRRR